MRIDVGQHWNLQGVCPYTIYEALVHGFSVSCAKQYGRCISIHNEWQSASCVMGMSHTMICCVVHFISPSHLMMLTVLCGMRCYWQFFVGLQMLVSLFKCLCLKGHIVVAFSVTTGFSFSILIKSQWRVIEMFYHSETVFLSNSWRSSPIKNCWPSVSSQTFLTSLHTSLKTIHCLSLSLQRFIIC